MKGAYTWNIGLWSLGWVRDCLCHCPLGVSLDRRRPPGQEYEIKLGLPALTIYIVRHAPGY